MKPTAMLLAAGVAAAPAPREDPLPPGAVVRLGTLRLRHLEGGLSLAFSPHGKTLASASRDGTILLRDEASRRVLRPSPADVVRAVEQLR